MWTVLVVLPLLVRTRHSQFPVKPGWMFEMVNALMGNNEGEIRRKKIRYHGTPASLKGNPAVTKLKAFYRIKTKNADSTMEHSVNDLFSSYNGSDYRQHTHHLQLA